MMTRAQHYRKAEQLIKDGGDSHRRVDGWEYILAAAQVHATLAAVPIDVWADAYEADWKTA